MKNLLARIGASTVAAIVAVSFLAINAGAQTIEVPSGDVTRGKAQFMSYGCYECHGTFGQGNYFGAPRIAPHPLPYAALLRYIRKPSGQMPSYSSVILPDKDAADIWTYLASIRPTKPVNSIPALAGVSKNPK